MDLEKLISHVLPLDRWEEAFRLIDSQRGRQGRAHAHGLIRSTGDHIMRRYGFIGLGIMGKPMCKNLLTKTGGPVVVYDLNDAPVQELVALGARRGFLEGRGGGKRRGPDDAAEFAGREGRRPRPRRRSRRGRGRAPILVNMSSIAPLAAQGNRRPAPARPASKCSTRRSAAASRRPSRARSHSWSAARSRSSIR